MSTIHQSTTARARTGSLKQRVEIRDGREFTVTTLPADRRLQPAETRKRAFWNTLTAGQKAAVIRRRKTKAKRKQRRKAGAAKRTSG